MIKLPFYEEIRIDNRDNLSWRETIENLKFGKNGQDAINNYIQSFHT